MKDERIIGEIYKLNDRSFKLVVGGVCNSCDLHESSMCVDMPPCELHDGHYKEVVVNDISTKTNNDYQRGFEAGRAEYKTTVLSLERQIEELKRALELASSGSAEFGYVDKNGEKIPCGGYYRRYNYLYQTYWSNTEFGYKGKIMARLSDKDKTTWLKEVSSCGFVLVSDGQSELVVDPEIV